jgi:hypothetical protein
MVAEKAYLLRYERSQLLYERRKALASSSGHFVSHTRPKAGVFGVQLAVGSWKTAEPQRLAAESPLPDLNRQILTQLVQAVLQTEKGRPSFLATADRRETDNSKS